RDQGCISVYRPATAAGLSRFPRSAAMKNAEFDAVIVGAGAGGAAAAYGLCRRGASVLLLEAGPRFDPINDYPLTGSFAIFRRSQTVRCPLHLRPDKN